MSKKLTIAQLHSSKQSPYITGERFVHMVVTNRSNRQQRGYLVCDGKSRHMIDETIDPSRTISFTFNECWVQGIIVKVNNDIEYNNNNNNDSGGGDDSTKNIYIDGGTGVIGVVTSTLEKATCVLPKRVGMYVLCAGQLCVNNKDNNNGIGNGDYFIVATKLVDLSHTPDRETLWNLEVISAQSNYYSASISSNNNDNSNVKVYGNTNKSKRIKINTFM